jgi:low temperature requirement protein LtrA
MRDRTEPHRPATPLELLFDLCFVVAVAVLAESLHHGLAEGRAASAVLGYALLFVPLWWAWMSYTWYATAFDNDDVLFRLLTLAQMAGVLAVASAIPSALSGDPVPFTIAYAAMRVPLVLQWIRAARGDVAHRRFATRYAVGIVLAQSIWLVALAVPTPARWGVWVLAIGADLLTPIWATRVAPGRVFHAGHIAERYGLFALIVLGETILAVTNGAREVIDAGVVDVGTVIICITALTVAFGIWWLYFDTLGRQALERHRRAAFIWGYGHALLYAAIAAIGAGVQAQLDVEGSETSSWLLVVPTGLVLLSLAWLQQAANVRTSSAVTLVAATVALFTVTAITASRPWAGEIAAAVTILCAIAVELRARPREPVSLVEASAPADGAQPNSGSAGGHFHVR